MQAVEELGQAAGEVDGAAVDVVEGYHAAHQPLALVGHGHTQQHPVEPGPPGVGVEPVELERGPVAGVEAPAHAGGADPLLGAGEVVVVETEAPAHRVTPGEIEHLGGGEAGVGQGQQLGDHAQQRVGLAQGAVGEAHPQVGTGRVAGVVGTGRVGAVLDVVHVAGAGAGAEGGVDERGEGLDVGAHDDDVPGLERLVLGQDVEDGVTQHLDLAGLAVAAVDLHAAVVRPEHGTGVVVAGQREARWRAVGPHVGLDALQEGGRRRLQRAVVVGLRAGAGGEHQLHLAGVPPPRAQQRVARHLGGVVLAAAHDPAGAGSRLGHPLPQHRRGMEQEEVHVALHRQSVEHLEVARGQAGQAEQREPAGQVAARPVVAQDGAGVVEALGRAGAGDPLAQLAPEHRLPGGVLP